MGRPRKQIPANAEQIIRAAAAEGRGKVGVALALGIDPELLRNWFDERPDLRLAFEAGREDERFALHSKLRRMAEDGHVVAALFLLKAAHGYVEGDRETETNRVTINFALPGALRPDQYTIDNEPADRTIRLPTTRTSRS